MAFKYRAKKNLGQNFLIDDLIIQKILDAIRPKDNDIIVEIGPGKGAITIPIAQSNAIIHAIEIDKDLIPVLQKKLTPFPNIKLHNQNALNFKMSDLGDNLRIIGNLPYNISTPLLFNLMKYRECISDSHVMIQKEVASRLTATPGNKNFGRLTVMFGTYMKTKHLFDVINTSFDPIPRVTSSFLNIRPKSNSEITVNNEYYLSIIVKQAFSQRRKTLRNALKGLVSDKIMENINICPTKRAEEIPIFKWSELANYSEKNDYE